MILSTLEEKTSTRSEQPTADSYEHEADESSIAPRLEKELYTSIAVSFHLRRGMAFGSTTPAFPLSLSQAVYSRGARAQQTQVLLL